MFITRKNYGGEWKICQLNAEEVAKAEDMTINYGLKIMRKIKKHAEAKEMVLTPEDVAAMLAWFGKTFESFSSDLIEAQYLQSKNKEAGPTT